MNDVNEVVLYLYTKGLTAGEISARFRRSTGRRLETFRSLACAFYAAIGVDLEGNLDVLEIWGPPALDGAKYWLSVLTDLKNRGVMDVFFLVCDGLKGLSDAMGMLWSLAVVHTYVLHLMRGHGQIRIEGAHSALRRDVKPITWRPLQPQPRVHVT